MSRIGLVLGGGGITGASFQMATLMALERACDWEASEADLVVGTSGGAYVAALVRTRRLDIDSLVRPGKGRRAVEERIRRQVFVPEPGLSMARWLRHGVIPSLRQPGVTAIMGSPARYSPRGIAAWVREQVGDMGDGWPPQPTVITAYDLSERGRIAFGSVTAPMVGIAEAVAASSAIPLLFHPYSIGGGVCRRRDGVGDSSRSRPGERTAPGPDHVIAPMAAATGRNRAWPHERLLDRVGRRSLEQEMARVATEWPDTDMLVLYPPPAVLMEMRPNPMAAEAAVPTFVRTLSAMKRKLAEHDVWEVLHRHLAAPRTEAVL